MSTATHTQSVKRAGEVEFVTFYVGDLLIGADIHHVEEINRLIDITQVPHAPAHVQGVINLRGEVVTVVDLGQILGLGATEIAERSRIVVVNLKDEQIGLLVDRIADVELASPDDVEPPPANVSDADGRFFKGVFKLESELLMILDTDAVLSVEGGKG